MHVMKVVFEVLLCVVAAAALVNDKGIALSDVTLHTIEDEQGEQGKQIGAMREQMAAMQGEIQELKGLTHAHTDSQPESFRRALHVSMLSPEGPQGERLGESKGGEEVAATAEAEVKDAEKAAEDASGRAKKELASTEKAVDDNKAAVSAGKDAVGQAEKVESQMEAQAKNAEKQEKDAKENQKHALDEVEKAKKELIQAENIATQTGASEKEDKAKLDLSANKTKADEAKASAMRKLRDSNEESMLKAKREVTDATREYKRSDHALALLTGEAKKGETYEDE